MEIIPRQTYIDKVERALGKEMIVVLVGQRRVGKSYLLHQLRRKKEENEGANVIYIDKENRQFDTIKTYRELNDYIEAHLLDDRHNYIMIDEAQDIAGFEHSVRSYRTLPATDVIITGSNARMFSTELSTLLGGRYTEIYIQPLSYTEFLTFHRITDSDDALAQYLDYGGLPGLVRIGLDEEAAREYQLNIYHTALLKDIVMRNAIRNVPFLESFVRFVADNTGKLLSANNICKFMRSQGEKLTPALIINYLNYLSQAYIIHRISRYDIHGKRILESNDKFYFEDNGIRNAIAGGRREGDIEKVIETVICQHLIRLGFRVYVGQLQAGEVDFVCEKSDHSRVYVQAAYVITDEATRQREFGNLFRIKDNYPKYVISMTPLVTRTDFGGITHLHLRKFLSEGLPG